MSFNVSRNLRHSQIIFLCFLLVGCHNNAHLRTQKVLKPGEKAYSGSFVLAVGGETRSGRLDYTGVPGMRGEVSMLTGRKGGEAGPYFGFGLSGDNERFVFTGGFDYKQYEKLFKENNEIKNLIESLEKKK